jgi:hypothetical protein
MPPYDRPDLRRFRHLFGEGAETLGPAHRNAIIARYNSPQFALPELHDLPAPPPRREVALQEAPSRRLPTPLPEIEEVPEYAPRPSAAKTGFRNRLVGFGKGMLEAAYATGGNPLAALAGGVAGAVDRDLPERVIFNRTTRAEASARQQRALAIRRQLMEEENRLSEMEARERTARAAERRAEAQFNAPVTQGEMLLARDGQGGFAPVMVGGQPVRNAAYARGVEGDAEASRRREAEIIAARERFAAEALERRRLRELQDRAALERMRQSGRDALRRTRLQEEGRSARHKADLESRIKKQPPDADTDALRKFFGQDWKEIP